MGAYRDDFRGFFHVALDRRWQQRPFEATTVIAQSRAIYLNAEAFRASREGRFRKAVEQGAAFLVRYFEDERGGFYWEVTPEGQPANRLKQGYGNVHALFALTHAYSVLGDPVYLDAAWRQLGVLQRYFADPAYPGGIRPGLSADLGATVGVNNVNVFTHYFETLLALHDVLTGSRREDVAHLIRQAERFLSGQLYHDEQGRTDRGYVAYNYTAAWEPAQAPYTFATQLSGAMHATPAHGIELAFLLSRAVERGFDPGWLRVADKLLRFAEVHCFDEPTGGLIYDITDYQGRPLSSRPERLPFIWWPQAEAARTLLHFTVVRGHDKAAVFLTLERFILDRFIDPIYGGWYQQVNRVDLQPKDLPKGDVWTVGYHEAMFYAEVLRLSGAYPERMARIH